MFVYKYKPLRNENKVLISHIKRLLKHKIDRRLYSNIIPNSQTKIIRRKNRKQSDNLKHENKVEKKAEEVSKEFRVNEVNIQMVSKNIYEQLFRSSSAPADPKIVEKCRNDLLRLGINYEKCSRLPDVQLTLPKLDGKDIVEHFRNIAEKQSAPYRNLLKQLAECDLPPLPLQWSKAEGWTKYEEGTVEPVPFPPDGAVVFDVEVLMSAGQRPTLACAVSTKAWYGWVSKPVASNAPHKFYDHLDYHELIPLETGGDEPGDAAAPRIVVGHNVSFDRAKIKEQYWLEKTGVRFMDTMSMHTCVSGVTSYQRAVLKTKNKEPHPSDDDWVNISSLNNLSDVHNLYCGTPVDKATRDVFTEGDMSDVHEHFQSLMHYCASDVTATHRVLRALLPLFLERFPHPATLAGMMEIGSAYLPVNSNWSQYIDSAETVFEDLKLESRQLLSLKADEACKLMVNEAFKQDLWMWDQDWSTQTLKLKKQTKKKVTTFIPDPKHKYILFAEKGIEHSKSNTNTNFETRSEEFTDKQEIMTKAEIKKFELLSQEFIDNVEGFIKPKITNEVEDLSKKFLYLYELEEFLPVKRPYLAGYPAWYRKLCSKPGKDPDWMPGANSITTSMQITPKLLRLCWEGYPLHHLKTEGWGFLVPFSREHSADSENLEPVLPLEQILEACPLAHCGPARDTDAYVLPGAVEEDLSRKAYFARKKKEDQAAANQYHGLGVWSGVQLQGCCHFLRLPHKDGPKYKVGNPLARDFLDMFSQNVLTAQGNDAEKVLSFGRQMSYWRNNRERIMSQQVVWLPRGRRPDVARQCGAILPQVVVCGTLTRRASEPTWMTASNASEERIGSELRAMVQAPRGYKFVGADVDSQELWIAALLGDSGLGICGGTPFGWSVLAGDKSAHTDLHSLTARAADINRSHAKVINYARIYGAGQTFAERLLKQFNPTMTVSEAKAKAARMYATTKGRRVYTLKKQYMDGFMDEDLDNKSVEMSSYQAFRLAKLSGKRVEEMFERPRWIGGTESDMFNKLEEIADCTAPSTAFLAGRLSRALEAAAGRWAGTRLNWAVQSAAADFLHLMLVAMAHLAPTSRFCLSFHDEVRYLVKDEDKYDAALALQITNLLTRAFCSQRVGINDLPQSVAFFTSVEVDGALRKESHQTCQTPSNPHGLEKGYGIPQGESLDILNVIKKCNKD